MTHTYLQDLQLGLRQLFELDERVILLGEDVLDPYGGAFKVTAGLSTIYPDRVLSTPISEAAITGFGAGLALHGYVPIVEIMFGDFLTLCADQIVNHAAKFSQMYDNVKCPLIVRTPMGGGRGYGPTHSQSLEKMFLGIPGLKIVAPSHFHKPGRTLQHIVAAECGPTIFIEHKMLYGEKLFTGSATMPVSLMKDKNGYEIAIVKNYLVGEPDLYILAYGGTSRLLHRLLEDLISEEIRVIALLPECIDPVPTDDLMKFVHAAERVVILDEGHRDFSWGAGVASLIYEGAWGNLLAPIKVVTSDRSIIPTSLAQEAEMLLSREKCARAVEEVLSWA